MSKLKQKVALVTGSARGLGRAYALRLAGLGADVVVADMDLNAAKEFDENLGADTVMDEIRNLGCKSLGIEANLSNKEKVHQVFEQVRREFGRLDVLVNNAGGGLQPPGEYTEDEFFRFTVEINLMTAVYCSEASSEIMIPQKGGKIVNVSSLAGIRGRFGGTPYSIAKAGIVQYTRVLAASLGPHGINVNCIAPGFIMTSRKIASGMGQQGTEETEDVALGRLGTPQDCAKVVEFLSTDLSDYVTGQCIPVCGGVLI